MIEKLSLVTEKDLQETVARFEKPQPLLSGTAEEVGHLSITRQTLDDEEKLYEVQTVLRRPRFMTVIATMMRDRPATVEFFKKRDERTSMGQLERVSHSLDLAKAVMAKTADIVNDPEVFKR